jgi:ferredoxin
VIKSPHPTDLYASNYFAEVDTTLCKGCGTCVKRCQLQARSIIDGVAFVDLDRCIGCGNCVVTCESGASRLHTKENATIPPKDKDTTFMKILAGKVGRWNMFKIRLKMLLGMRV